MLDSRGELMASTPTGRRSLHIAWIGFAPVEEVGGVPGIATDLLRGLAALGHRIDCFFPSQGHAVPPAIADVDNLTLVWGTGSWRPNRWYSRTKVTAFVSSLLIRGLASLRLRKEVVRRHRREPYDLIYQFSNVENMAVPRRLRSTVPVVVHPGTSSAGELKFLLKERSLALRCQPAYIFAVAASVLWLREQVQRRQMQGARLVICISSVFRDHLLNDYGLPGSATVVVPNPVRLDRFEATDRPLGRPPTVMVLGRIAARKGVEDMVAVANRLFAESVEVRFRVVGGASLWSNYTGLLDDLPSEISEYVGRVPSSRVPAELAGSDVLLQASRYEPFALTVSEALAAGVPVVATSEVGATEHVDGSVATVTEPGDVEGMARGIEATIRRLAAEPAETRARARAEARRLFAPEVICEQISDALERLIDGEPLDTAAALPTSAGAGGEFSRTPS